MLSRIQPLLDILKNVFKARKGRPVALVLLLVLLLANLVSEWPAELPQNPWIVKAGEWLPTPFKGVRQGLFDQYQRHFPRQPESQPVTIVAIDESSLASIGQWPWPRNKLAALIDAINARKPLAIGLDIYMPEADQTSPDKVAANLAPAYAALATELKAIPTHDTQLAASLHAAPTILGAAAFDQAAYTTSTDLGATPVQVLSGNPLQYAKHFDNVLASLPELQSAAHGEAMLSVALEQGVVRRIPLVLGLGPKLVPGLAMEMLRVATGSATVDVRAGKTGIESVAVADAVVPTQTAGEIWLHFAPFAKTRDRYVSAKSVLDGSVDPARLENKLVLIGLTGAGLNDMRTTALGELVPGIEIQAQVIESIFDNHLLLRPPWLKWFESGLILVMGSLMIWYVPNANSRLAVLLRHVPKAKEMLGLLCNLLLLSSGFLVFSRYGYLLDAGSVFVVLSVVLGSLVSSALVEIEQKRKDEEAVAQSKREADAFLAGQRSSIRPESATFRTTVGKAKRPRLGRASIKRRSM